MVNRRCQADQTGRHHKHALGDAQPAGLKQHHVFHVQRRANDQRSRQKNQQIQQS
jgi:hypothetical protein